MKNQPIAGRIITPPPERWRDSLVVAVPPAGRASSWRAILVASPDGRLVAAEPVAEIATARTFEDLVAAVHAEAAAMDDADRRGVATTLGYGGAPGGLFALALHSIDRLLGTGPAAAVRVSDVALDMAGPGGAPIPGASKAARAALESYRDTDGRSLVTARVGGSTVWARTYSAAEAAARDVARENGQTTRRVVPVQVAPDLWAAAVKASRTERTARRAVYRELAAAAAGAWPVPPAPSLDGPDDPDAAGPISVWHVHATVVVALEAAHGAGCVPRAIRAAVRRVAEGSSDLLRDAAIPIRERVRLGVALIPRPAAIGVVARMARRVLERESAAGRDPNMFCWTAVDAAMRVAAGEDVPDEDLRYEWETAREYASDHPDDRIAELRACVAWSAWAMYGAVSGAWGYWAGDVTHAASQACGPDWPAEEAALIADLCAAVEAAEGGAR